MPGYRFSEPGQRNLDKQTVGNVSLQNDVEHDGRVTVVRIFTSFDIHVNEETGNLVDRVENERIPPCNDSTHERTCWVRTRVCEGLTHSE